MPSPHVNALFFIVIRFLWSPVGVLWKRVVGPVGNFGNELLCYVISTLLIILVNEIICN